VPGLELRRMRTETGYCLQRGDGVVFVFCMATILKLNYLAMLTKTMTAPKPVATSRRANMGSNWALCFVERNGTIHEEQEVLP